MTDTADDHAAGTAGRRFPILLHYRYPDHERGKLSISWSLIAPHEAQAQKNHSQSLERLAERGGLSPAEAVCVLRDEPWREPWYTLGDLMLAVEAALYPPQPSPVPDEVRVDVETAARAVESLYLDSGGRILCGDTIDAAAERVRSLARQRLAHPTSETGGARGDE